MGNASGPHIRNFGNNFEFFERITNHNENDAVQKCIIIFTKSKGNEMDKFSSFMISGKNLAI